MPALLSPLPVQRFYDNNNNPLAGGLLYTYQAGTSTPVSTYTDATAGTPNPNPVVLNARGEAPVWLSPTQAYKFILKDSAGNTIWTADNLTSPVPVTIGNMTDELGSGGTPGFAAGVDFTAGTTTSLTLSKIYGSAANLWIAFDAAEQGADSYSLSGTTLTFTSAIPVGVSKVYVKGGTALTISAPGTGSVTDSSVAANAGIQSSKLSFLQGGTGAVSRTVQSKLRDRVSVLDFGADNTGTNDSTTAIANAWAYVSTNPQQMELVFPQGIYLYNTSPNFAVNHARIVPEGEVRLRYTGTATAVILDAGASSGNIYDVTFGIPGQPFIIETASTTSNACIVRAVHHSTISIKPRNAGASSAGLAVYFAVCTKFYVTCSVNEDGGWYNSQQPTYGIYLSQRNTGEAVSYCLFDSPIIEGPVNGIFLDYADGNMFLSGTSEGCTNIGVTLTSHAQRNTFMNMDFEVNTNSDWDDSGVQNKMLFCDASKLSTLKGTAGEIYGGFHNSITIAGTSTAAHVHDLRYNVNGTGGTITDNGVLTYGLPTCFAASPGSYSLSVAPFSIPIGSPPSFTWTNNRPYPVYVVSNGGTVTAVTLNRNGTAPTVFNGSSLNSGGFMVGTGDILTITCSVAPTTLNGFPMG